VCFYLGKEGTKDENINPKEFDDGCGKSLKRKGLLL
jgi:hypothetical protein